MHSFDWATLAQEWRNHKYSYGDKSESSAKSKHALWATKQMEAIDALLDPSKKFMGQLNKIFNNETVDLVHVSADQAAFGFLKPMDELVLKSRSEASRKVRLIMTN
jgi:hypothetical protein